MQSSLMGTLCKGRPPVRGLATLCLALLCACAVHSAAQAQDTQLIADNDALKGAIARGVAGKTLLLAPGVYDSVVMRGAGVPAVMRSAEPENPAVLHSLLVEDFDGLILEHLVLDYRFDPADQIAIRPFIIRRCKNITLRNSRIDGDDARGLGAPHDGKGYGVGLEVGDCHGVQLEANRFEGSWRALAVGRSRDIIVRGNEVTGHRMDGLGFAAVRNLRIEDNVIHSFNRAIVPQDHADMIQFWSAGTQTPSRDIVIRRNLLHSGSGLMTQSIFIRNERVDSGEAGEEMFYRNILIEDNVIINAHAHGITVGETKGLTIRRNTMVQNPASAVVDPKRMVATPQITVTPKARDVTITGNITHKLTGLQNQPDWQVENNLIIQNFDPDGGREGLHYSLVFKGGTAPGLAPYQPRPGGPADTPAIGSRMLR
jgi:hypothetical protein